MKKKIITIGLWTGIFMATMIVACAITNLFFTKSHTSEFSKKKIFQFDLDTGMNSGEVGPGDSFPVSPVIFNDATEEMYVFIQVDMATTADGVLYLFDVDDEWIKITYTVKNKKAEETVSKIVRIDNIDSIELED